jgi:hypothetical protein
MNETLIGQKIAWRRETAQSHYIGELWGCVTGIRLAGRDPQTGIEVTLSIPYAEIGRIRVSNDWTERVVGERCVVLELTGSTPILVREVGLGPIDARALAERIAMLAAIDSRTAVAAAS